jgi:hypothetical protein
MAARPDFDRKEAAMRTASWFCIAVVIVTTTGCVPSLHPVFTKGDVVFEEKLLGEWREKHVAGKASVVTITRLDDNAYRVVSGNPGKTGVFRAHLVRLGKHLFMDLSPGKKLPKDGFHGVPYIPTHLVVRVHLDGAELRMDGVDHRKLEKMLERNPAALKHEKVKGSVLITAPTAELQKFLIAHAVGDALFGKGKPLVKRQ